MINLETVLNQEGKLWSIFQHVKAYHTSTSAAQYYLDLTTLSEDWWTATRDSACMFELYKIYRESATRKTLRRALILEAITVILTVRHC
jgi:hypothetical protein